MDGLLSTIKKIRGQCPTLKCRDLKTACDALISKFSIALKDAVSDDINADEYFDVFQLALESRFPRVIEAAMEGLIELIEKGHFRGDCALMMTNIVAGSKYTKSASLACVRAPPLLIDHMVLCVAHCCEETDEVVHMLILKTLYTATTSVYCKINGVSLILVMRAFMHIYLCSRNAINRSTAKSYTMQLLDATNLSMEESYANFVREQTMEEAANKDESVGVSPPSPPSVGQECEGGLDEGTEDYETKPEGDRASRTSVGPLDDEACTNSLALFEELCKWTTEAPRGNTTLLGGSPAKMNDAQSKMGRLQALDLLKTGLNKAGPAFRTRQEFIEAIRDSLCSALLETCTSHDNEITSMSLQIFVLLLEGYKEQLRTEVEVFVTTILMKTLESGYSTYDHKVQVLEVFHSICRDTASLIECFVNFDCDLDSENIFRDILDGFTKIVSQTSLRGSNSTAAHSTIETVMGMDAKVKEKEAQSLRDMGLRGLLLILRSLLANIGFPTEENGDLIKEEGSPAQAAESLDVQETSHEVAGSRSTSVDEEHKPRSSLAMDAYDRKQRLVEEIQTGILKFNLKPAKGLTYLHDLGHIEKTPVAVAQFLHANADKLNKTVVGDYLGREKEYENGFCLHVLNEYVAAMDFEGLEFSEAIRLFLRGFYLPGEAQKIDRIMERFAERYYIQNTDTFASADMAFILAFSTIMLQTNLHNQAIKDDKRMTKEQFLKQNKGISTDGELSDELLIGIYDRIQAEPISMNNAKDDNKRKVREEVNGFTVFQATANKRRMNAFDDERKEMMKEVKNSITKRNSTVASRNVSIAGSDINTGKALANTGSGANTANGELKQWLHLATSSTPQEAFTRPMFELAWAPMLGVLSQVLETTTDAAAVEMCLGAFQCAIHLACRLEMAMIRSSYINALVNFTTLDTVREIVPKNIMAIRLLMSITVSEGDYLEESWSPVLQCISQLARLQHTGQGLQEDEMFFRSSQGNDERNKLVKFFGTMATDRDKEARLEEVRQVEEANAALLVRELNNINVDNVFMYSQHLSQRSVQQFVSSLCQVSMLEINSVRSIYHTSNTRDQGKDSPGNHSAAVPRVFSLQKLVEVADFNMTVRSRIAWSQMWAVLANHFTSVGMCENISLAMFAIDSLKQLSVKFLMKPELSNFNFQALFLKPFEVILRNAKSEAIKDLILGCIDNMILACAKNIRSGWRTIFAILEVAATADDESSKNIVVGFDMLRRLVENHFDLLIYDFLALNNCLVTFASSKNTPLVFKALHLISICADNLANGKVDSALVKQHSASDTTRFGWSQGKERERRSLSFSAVSSGAMQGVSTTKVCEAGKEDTESGRGVEGGEEEPEGDRAADDPFRLWWPVLLGMSTCVADPRIQVRLRALETLQNLLCQYGHTLFSSRDWTVIFRSVLFPLMDNIHKDNTRQHVSSWPAESKFITTADSNSWIGTMGLPVLASFIELYQLNRRTNTESLALLADLLDLISACIQHEVESLAKIGVQSYNDLVCALTAGESEDSAGENDDEESGAGVDDFFREARASGTSTSGGGPLPPSPTGELPDAMSAQSTGTAHQLPIEIVSLLSRHLTLNAASLLCTDFGPVGRLTASKDLPENVLAAQLRDCPVAARRHMYREPATPPRASHDATRDPRDDSRASTTEVGGLTFACGANPSSASVTPLHAPLESQKSRALSVDTAYGSGVLIELVGEDSYAERVKIQLPYGTLYTCQEDAVEAMAREERRQMVANARSSASSPSPARPPVVSNSGKSHPSAFSRVRGGVMTSMVATLGVINSSRIFFTSFREVMDESMYVDMLEAMELVHWHARSFNEDQQVRADLRGQKFMVFASNPLRSPNLLEQEVDSAKEVLEVSLWLLGQSGQPSLQDLAENWLQRYLPLVVSRYLDLDETLATESPLPSDIVEAYKPAVLVGLTGLAEASEQSFPRILALLKGLVPRIVLAHDREVRQALAIAMPRMLEVKYTEEM